MPTSASDSARSVHLQHVAGKGGGGIAEPAKRQAREHGAQQVQQQRQLDDADADDDQRDKIELELHVLQQHGVGGWHVIRMIMRRQEIRAIFKSMIL